MAEALPGFSSLNDLRVEALRTEVCIVGSGFAGTALALRLLEAGVPFLLCEAGGPETPRSGAQQADYRVALAERQAETGLTILIDPSLRDRKRTLGGSSECWSGWIKPFQPEGYRPSVRGWSGWQGLGERLARHDREALRLLGSPLLDFTPDRVLAAHGFGDVCRNSQASLDPVRTTIYGRLLEPTRCRQLLNARRSRFNGRQMLLHHCALTGLEAAAGGGAIAAAHFRSPTGRRLRVQARQIVLAMGGLENARHLLILDREQRLLAAESRPWLGLFMEHPHFYGEAILTDVDHRKLPACYYRYIPAGPGSGRFKAAFELPGLPPDRSGRGERPALTATLEEFSLLRRLSWRLPGGPTDERRLLVTLRAEQLPLATSRLALREDFGPLGLPALQLAWTISPDDLASYNRSVRNLAAWLRLNGIGVLRCTSRGGSFGPDAVDGGAHHMGTTRFGPEPRHGVVDGELRVHGLTNLHCVGSSVFPSSGFENPTVAVVSSALHVADVLLRKRSSPEQAEAA
jgi:hypothetical protein